MTILKDYLCAITVIAALVGAFFAKKHLDFTEATALESQQRRFEYLCDRYGEVRISSKRIIKCQIIASDEIKRL